MVEVLEFVFKDAWHFMGIMILILWIGICVGIARGVFRVR